LIIDQLLGRFSGPGDDATRREIRMRTDHATDPLELLTAAERWERAEAEVESDVLDADLEAYPAATVARGPEVLRPAAVTEADLVEAECETDLIHVDGPVAA
jgi:hypothetical protein